MTINQQYKKLSNNSIYKKIKIALDLIVDGIFRYTGTYPANDVPINLEYFVAHP